jgi:hypothetical protein
MYTVLQMHRPICKWAGRLLAVLPVIGLPQFVAADTIVFQGVITQSTADGTGPAINNPALNSIADGDNFMATLNFIGAINSPGTYPLAGATLLFRDTSAGAIESDFGALSITISANGLFDDISLLGCLNSGSGCLLGNQLAANFEIDGGLLNSENVAAATIFGLSPATDLLEDDGSTDIQGSVNLYSYRESEANQVPEPATVGIAFAGLLALAAMRRILAL